MLHAEKSCCSFGRDPYPIILNDVDCSSSEYLVILQCSFSTSIGSNCLKGRDEVSVTCCELYCTLIIIIILTCDSLHCI